MASLSVLLPGEDEEEVVAPVDPYELLEPVEILSKMPKDFYEKIVSLMIHKCSPARALSDLYVLWYTHGICCHEYITNWCCWRGAVELAMK